MLHCRGLKLQGRWTGKKLHPYQIFHAPPSETHITADNMGSYTVQFSLHVQFLIVGRYCNIHGILCKRC